MTTMKKIAYVMGLIVMLLVAGSCGFLGDDKKGGDDRGSDPKNEGTDTQLVLPFERPYLA